MQDTIFITSLIIRVRPDKWLPVTDSLAVINNLEVTASAVESGKMVAVFESESLADITAVIDRIEKINGVVGATMVYQYSDSATVLNEEIA